MGKDFGDGNHLFYENTSPNGLERQISRFP